LTPEEQEALRKAHEGFARKQAAKREGAKVDDRREASDKN
jgi:hypothetical protein